MKVQGLMYGVLVSFSVTLLVLQEAKPTAAQQAFELPVELIGFPAIILAVRLSNFVKKLAYSLNPRTYTSRSRRAALDGQSAIGDEMIDLLEAEKRLVAELGENVCIYTRVCLHHAEKAKRTLGRNTYNLDWEDIFSNYKSSEKKSKEYYLLSVFLGDIVASPRFCNQLAKRGRACKE